MKCGGVESGASNGGGWMRGNGGWEGMVKGWMRGNGG